MFCDIEPYKLNLKQVEVADIRTTDRHKVGTEQGEGNALPLDDIATDTQTADIQSNGLSKAETVTENDCLVDCPIVVFIVSTEETGEINAINSTSIICYTMPVGNGEHYVWYGGNGSWAWHSHLYYSIQAGGDKNGIASVRVTEYMLGEKSDRPVYVRQIIGVRSEVNERDIR